MQTFEFQAETKRLLYIMINSLYTNKDIFLRELLSNSADALERLRVLSLTAPEVLDTDARLEILIDVDPNARTLTVTDTGIGMTYDEVISNIGTIAQSGTRALNETCRNSGLVNPNLIGHFGVGFYSSFMVANRVSITTRHATDPTTGTRWESTGDGSYQIGRIAAPQRGTVICLHLKQPDPNSAIEDYCDHWKLSEIVRKYSAYLSYQITIADAGTGIAGVPPRLSGLEQSTRQAYVLPPNRPLWTRSPSTIGAEEYRDFYQNLSGADAEPLQTLHLRAEGVVDYCALLFIPSEAPHDLYYHSPNIGLRLFSKGVILLDKSEDLLPRYLRFVKGVVDVGDLPLNISRQRLQQDQHIADIRKWLSRKLLDAIRKIQSQDTERYLQFWKHFGRALKEGYCSEFDTQESILPLLIFASSNNSDRLTNLSDYVARMKPEQRDIFYLTGESRTVIESSPHLEMALARELEVLFLSDSVDELVLQQLTVYAGKRLKSLAKGHPAFDDSGIAQPPCSTKVDPKKYGLLMESLQAGLGRHIKRVQLSSRLTSSPVCLVVEESEYSPFMERLLLKGKGAGAQARRILEINPSHELIEQLTVLGEYRECHDVLHEAAELLFGIALLSEGSDLQDLTCFKRSALAILRRALDQKLREMTAPEA